MYVLGEMATFLSFEGVVLHEAVLCGPEVQSSLATRARCSVSVPHVGHMRHWL